MYFQEAHLSTLAPSPFTLILPSSPPPLSPPPLLTPHPSLLTSLLTPPLSSPLSSPLSGHARLEKLELKEDLFVSPVHVLSTFTHTSSTSWVRVPPEAAHFSIDCLGCAVLLCLVACLTLIASFFLPSHLSLKLMYIHACTCIYMCMCVKGVLQTCSYAYTHCTHLFVRNYCSRVYTICN